MGKVHKGTRVRCDIRPLSVLKHKLTSLVRDNPLDIEICSEEATMNSKAAIIKFTFCILVGIIGVFNVSEDTTADVAYHKQTVLVGLQP